jgi:hypothetical protein
LCGESAMFCALKITTLRYAQNPDKGLPQKPSAFAAMAFHLSTVPITLTTRIDLSVLILFCFARPLSLSLLYQAGRHIFWIWYREVMRSRFNVWEEVIRVERS